ncbi:unnamed protein product [Chondrus crispus]|uniref:Uncharacterized protein n=1 Tax=Chondrus crispus TaxID=2769 RepID=R7QDM1_CHOCR|nr:unnamed protein product [Chondrus crispus]CDF36612.1 unnamed protein product [Chondrus crispus]|eukprot:XP_005716431.1 unnamed protein product [Chondrus crispus]
MCQAKSPLEYVTPSRLRDLPCIEHCPSTSLECERRRALAVHPLRANQIPVSCLLPSFNAFLYGISSANESLRGEHPARWQSLGTPPSPHVKLPCGKKRVGLLPVEHVPKTMQPTREPQHEPNVSRTYLHASNEKAAHHACNLSLQTRHDTLASMWHVTRPAHLLSSRRARFHVNSSAPCHVQYTCSQFRAVVSPYHFIATI